MVGYTKNRFFAVLQSRISLSVLLVQKKRDEGSWEFLDVSLFFIVIFIQQVAEIHFDQNIFQLTLLLTSDGTPKLPLTLILDNFSLILISSKNSPPGIPPLNLHESNFAVLQSIFDELVQNIVLLLERLLIFFF